VDPQAPSFDPAVRGPAAIAALCLRCFVVLAVGNLGVAAATSLQEALHEEGFYPLGLVAVVVAVAAVPVAVVGFPAGLLTAHLLQRVRSEWVHVLAFAVVGAVLAVAIVGWVQPDPVGPIAAWLMLEGAVGAGGARWWSGWARRRVAARDDPPSEQHSV